MSEYLGKGSRLSKGPSESLAASAFAYELRATPFLFEYLGYADMAHVAALVRGGILGADIGRRLLAGLLRFQATPYASLEFDPFVGDIYNNRDGFLKQALGPEADRIHIGRARREATTTAWQLACRRRMVHLGRATTELCDVMVGLCQQHRGTIMPDFTYLQHAHPTTLGHYLLGFLYPLLRDEERISLATARLNRCPAGSGSVNGSRFPIDRDYIASLLAFDGLMTHNRDAMWAPDMTTEVMTSLVTTMTNIDRLAEDLFVWATEEFSLVDLSDAHCRTSVIMPQKKNPYGLAHIRGHARSLVGTFTGLVCNGLTVSGQPDNRVFAYHDLPEAIDDTRQCVELMRDILAGCRFETERMGEAVRKGYAYATDLCDFLVVETGLDNRSAHRLIGLAVSRCSARNAEITAQDAHEAAAALGIELSAFDTQAFEKNREPEVLVGLRRGAGGAADAPMTAMLTEARAHIDRAHRTWRTHSDIDFETRLVDRIGDLTGRSIVLTHSLTLPERTSKPRQHGRTQLLDKGLGVAHVTDEVAVAGAYVDLVKLGWGTAVITPNLREKIEAYRRFDIEVSFGGTLFELYFLQNKLDDYAAWLKDLGIKTVEISDGTIQIELSAKMALIERFGRDFRVLSEVGSKDDTVVVSPQAWVRAIKAELEAGAAYVILEGRESGTTGMYRSTGEVRMGLLQDILESGVAPERIVFETPNKAQQVYMIKLLGPNVNLANIAVGDVIALETLRQGLRADTLLHIHGKGAGRPLA